MQLLPLPPGIIVIPAKAGIHDAAATPRLQAEAVYRITLTSSRQGRVSRFSGRPRSRGSGVVPNSKKDACDAPLFLTHERRGRSQGLPIEGPAASRTVRHLLGVSLASLVVVEEHPLVLPTHPPELPPEVSPLRARTHQTRHRTSYFVNTCADSNLHDKACADPWPP